MSVSEASTLQAFNDIFLWVTMHDELQDSRRADGASGYESIDTGEKEPRRIDGRSKPCGY